MNVPMIVWKVEGKIKARQFVMSRNIDRRLRFLNRKTKEGKWLLEGGAL